MGDFVDDLKTKIISTMPDVSPDWAEFCSLAPLSAVFHDARIIEQEKYLKVNLLFLMVGPSGIKKSMPMTTWTYAIIKELGDRLHRDLLLPNRSSVEGFIHYIQNVGEDDPPRNAGLMIRDEFGGLFNQLRKADWQADGMEFISEMYDGIFQKRSTVTHGLNEITELHASLISATTPHFVSMLDTDFFVQGTGNRILYCYYDIDSFKPVNLDPIGYFRQSWTGKRENEIAHLTERLASVYRKGIENIYVMDDAGKLWIKYKKECEWEWKKRALKDPLGWDYQPIKRHPELALKLSALYAISSQIDRIPKVPKKIWDNSVVISLKDMERGIERMDIARKHFEEIVRLKRENLKAVVPLRMTDEAQAILSCVPKKGFIDVKTWWDKQEITANATKFNKLKQICINNEWVKEYTYMSVPLPQAEKIKYNANTRFYTIFKTL